MEQDKIILSKVNDKIAQCSDGYYVTATSFLDSHEQAIALSAIKSAPGNVHAFFYGGYDNAERRMIVCVPSDWSMSTAEATSDLISVLRVKVGATARPLTHRDYLGAMLGLGLDRGISGDILVRDDGADIIIAESIADFLLKEFNKVGRYDIACSILPLAELIVPQQEYEIVKDTVPSLRLDNIVSAAFKTSRKNALEAINAGIVSVNHIEVNKPDAKVDEGSTIVLRGRGKAILSKIGGESKKNRIWVEIKRYK